MHLAGNFCSIDSHLSALKLISDTPLSDSIEMHFYSDSIITRQGFQLEFLWQASRKRIKYFVHMLSVQAFSFCLHTNVSGIILSHLPAKP